MAGPHHRGKHPTISAYIRAHAYNNPNAVCAITGRTLDQCGYMGTGRNRNGTPATWDADHIEDGNPNAGYQLTCSYHNRSRGAANGNRRRAEPHSEQW